MIVYRHNKHPINLYVWPSAGSDSAVQVSSHHGYNLVHWAVSGMNYWAISDLEEEKMLNFAKSIQGETKKMSILPI